MFCVCLFSLFKSQLWGTVLNAFEKSIMIMSTCDLVFIKFARSCVVLTGFLSNDVVCQIRLSIGQDGPFC